MTTFCRRDGTNGGDDTAPAHLVDTAETALATIFLAAHQPERNEVIALLLEADYIGHTVVVVDGTTSPDAVVEVMELIGQAAAESGRRHAIVLASVRPGLGALPGDVDRWIELTDLADTHGCELLEWFVIGDGVATCPRDFLVEPPRWPGPERPVPW